MKPSAFPYAASLGDIDLVKGLIESGGNVDARDSGGSTSLHLAIESGKSSDVVTQIVELLLVAGASLEARNERGHTPLHVASADGHFESVEQLIRAGAQVDAEIDSNGFTSLFLAIKADRPNHDRTQIIRLLVETGASLDKQDFFGFDPLRKAVALGKVNAVKQLILLGANVHAINGSGKSVLLAATRSLRNEDDALRIIQMLLEAGASPNIADCRGITPLRAAALSGNTKRIDQLIKAGADVDAIDKVEKETILHSVIYSRQPDKECSEVVRLLSEAGASFICGKELGYDALQATILRKGAKTLEQLILAGADVNKPCPHTGDSYLHVTLDNRYCKDGISIVRLLLDAGADINARNGKLRTPLHIAAEVGNLKVFKELVAAGADVDAIDSKGQTILSNIILSSKEFENRMAMARIVLDAGANLHTIDSTGQIIFSSMILPSQEFKNRMAMVRIILDAGADVDAIDSQGRTVLSHVILSYREFKNRMSIVRMLLDKGASVDPARGDPAWSPLQCAIKRGYIGILEQLILARSISQFGRVEPTCLHAAVCNGEEQPSDYSKMLRILLDAGADLDGRDEWKRTPLHVAVCKGHVEWVEALIEAGADLNATDSYGRTSLHRAITLGKSNERSKIISSLLRAGSSPNALDYHGNTPLRQAINLSDADLLRQLITAGANVKITSNDGSSSLHYAILSCSCNERGKIISLLIEAGAPVNIPEKKKNLTPLHCAVKAGDVGAVEQLIRAGADVTAVTKQALTSLHLALCLVPRNSNTCRIIQMLLQAGASPNIVKKDGETPLIYALRLSDEILLQELITAGADVKMTTPGGLSYLHYAILEGACRNRGKIIPLLIKAGVSVDVRDKRKSQTPLHFAVKDGDVEAVEQLIIAGANVNAVDYNSMTCLNLIFDRDKLDDNHYEIVHLLLEAGAKVDSPDVKGKTPLIHAVSLGHSKLVGTLIAAGANVKVSAEGLTILHHAVRSYKGSHCYCQIIALLKRAGAPLESRDPDGWTPLMFAVAERHIRLVEQFIELAADVNAINNAGRTILFMVCEGAQSGDLNNSDRRFIRLLVAAGAELTSPSKDPSNQNWRELLARAPYEYIMKCKEELQLMLSSYIHGSITYYQILKRKKTYEYVRNVHVIEQFKEKTFSRFFPIYGEDLEKSFSAVLDRQKLMNPASHGLWHILKFGHALIHDHILENLDDADLQNLHRLWWHQSQLCNCEYVPLVQETN